MDVGRCLVLIYEPDSWGSGDVAMRWTGLRPCRYHPIQQWSQRPSKIHSITTRNQHRHHVKLSDDPYQWAAASTVIQWNNYRGKMHPEMRYLGGCHSEQVSNGRSNKENRREKNSNQYPCVQYWHARIDTTVANSIIDAPHYPLMHHVNDVARWVLETNYWKWKKCTNLRNKKCVSLKANI